MKKMRIGLGGMVVAGALLSMGGPAFAGSWVGTLNTGAYGVPSNDGVLSGVSGFDWHANGAAWVQGFDLTAASATGDIDVFTLQFQAFAGSIIPLNPGDFPKLNTGYEFTTFATMNEVAVKTSSGIDIFTLPGGTWDIYFQGPKNNNPSAGTGFTDGHKVMSGTFTGGAASFFATSPAPFGNGFGGGTVFGEVTFVDWSVFGPVPPPITRDIVGTEIGTTLNFPGTAGTFTRPAAFNGVATGSNTASNFVLQADAYQSFNVVPEPGTISLLGLGLLGLGGTLRRRQKK